MGLFQRKAEPQQPVEGRRRPSYDRSSESESNRPQAFSYYAQRTTSPDSTVRQPLESFREETRAPRSWPQLFAHSWAVVGSGLVLLLGLGCITYLGTDPKIVPVTSSGSAYFMQDTAAYKQTAAKALSASILNYSKLTADTGKVSAELLKAYPEIRTATVTLPFIGTQPVVRVEPYKPSLILTTSDNAAYLLDTNGRALVSASQIADAGELSVPTIQDKTVTAVQLGNQALPTGTVRFISDIAAILKAAGVGTTTMTLPNIPGEFDVTIAGKSYFVKFNLQGEAKQQAGTFLATKQRLEKDKIVPGQYIDVRVSDRAYYK